ncbi:MAG: efflux RND transporter periplasmic adaptor subunit, partial [Chloroflexi bacterium]|nr:efflux RND transporter periplasmic adaptor subunit [Chloroflexota bacterium]
MQAAFDQIKGISPWQILILFAILLGGAGASYGVYALVSGSSQLELAQNQQLIPVQYGDLTNRVSTNGSIIFSTREALAFGTQGTVAEVFAEEGERVEDGDLLLRLDDATVASLEESVANARFVLRNAEEALALANDPHTPLDIAQAEANVANASLSLMNAQKALDEVQDGPAEQLGDTGVEVNSASTVLANARGDLMLARNEWGEKVQEAQDASDAAEVDYVATFARWLGIYIDGAGEEADLAPDTLLDSWGADLESLFNPDLRYLDSNKAHLADGPTADDQATPWDEVTLYTWLNFYPGPIVPTCEDGVVPSQGACVMKEMNDAWSANGDAKDALSTTETQSAKAIANAEVAVAKAEESFSPLEVDLREKQLVVAEATLAKAGEDLAELKGSVDPLEVTLREAELASAQATLDTAIQRLEDATLQAPMAGIISLVNVEAGQAVNANTTVVEVVDPSVVEVDGVVDEIDVLFIQQGARAEVTLDALPGQVLEGTVSDIGSAAIGQQGIVSYPVR